MFLFGPDGRHCHAEGEKKPFFFFQLDIHRQLRGGGWKKRDGAKQHLQPHTADNQKEEEEHTSRN
jgi:hypothetical protein